MKNPIVIDEKLIEERIDGARRTIEMIAREYGSGNPSINIYNAVIQELQLLLSISASAETVWNAARQPDIDGDWYYTDYQNYLGVIYFNPPPMTNLIVINREVIEERIKEIERNPRNKMRLREIEFLEELRSSAPAKTVWDAARQRDLAGHGINLKHVTYQDYLTSLK